MRSETEGASTLTVPGEYDVGFPEVMNPNIGEPEPGSENKKFQFVGGADFEDEDSVHEEEGETIQEIDVTSNMKRNPSTKKVIWI